MFRFTYVVCVLTITIAYLASDSVSLPSNRNHDVKLYTDNVDFINNVTIKDSRWLPILKEKVNMVSLPRKHLNHFSNDSSPDTPAEMIVVNPFKEILDLKLAKSFVGTEISFIMEAIKRSMVCSTMKHVSLQGFLLHYLIQLDNSSEELPYIVRWLEHMIQVSIDKLAAVNQKLPIMAKINLHVRSLLEKDVALTSDELIKISQEMFRESKTVCATPEGQGHYRNLIKEFNKSMSFEDLKNLEMLMADENIKGLSELHNIKEIYNYHGSLDIKEDVDPEEFKTLKKDELKKILTINRIRMNYLFLNLPVKSLAELQWRNIFNSKPLSGKEKVYS